jgi:type 1 fimbria pilin
VTVPPNPGSKISLNALSINFGKVKVGSSKSKNLKIRNAGKVSLAVMAMPPGTPFTSSGGDFNLAPKGKTSVVVTFNPTSKGSVSGSMTILSSDRSSASVGISLSGTGK